MIQLIVFQAISPNSHLPLTSRLCLRLLQIFISNMKFNVEFTINRYALRLQHRAVELAVKHQLEEVLFPSGAAAANLPMPKLRCVPHTREEPCMQAAHR